VIIVFLHVIDHQRNQFHSTSDLNCEILVDRPHELLDQGVLYHQVESDQFPLLLQAEFVEVLVKD
jgi:hypothetical protein